MIYFCVAFADDIEILAGIHVMCSRVTADFARHRTCKFRAAMRQVACQPNVGWVGFAQASDEPERKRLFAKCRNPLAPILPLVHEGFQLGA